MLMRQLLGQIVNRLFDCFIAAKLNPTLFEIKRLFNTLLRQSNTTYNNPIP